MSSDEPELVVREMDEMDFLALRDAVELLENPSLAARLADLAGAPLEKLMNRLPKGASAAINQATETALKAALNLAIATMKPDPRESSKAAHKAAVIASGAIGGVTGLPGLAIELPITTTIIFRAIADIARAEGEDIHDPNTCVACMTVFSLGGPTTLDDQVESGYFAARVALTQTVREAAAYLARGLTREVAKVEAPLLVRLIVGLSSRFGIVVSWKAAAQLVPVIGALGGAAVNSLFMDHFQNMARGHFIIRRLERQYGQERVREIYDRVRKALQSPRNLRPLPPAVPPDPAEVVEIESKEVNEPRAIDAG